MRSPGRLAFLRRQPDLDERDLAMVRRAERRAAWLAAALVAVSFLLCGGLVVLVVVTGQDSDIRSQLQNATIHADDVGDPPEGISLLLRRSDGSEQITPGAPSVLPSRSGISAVLAPGGPSSDVRDLDAPTGDFRVWTQRRSGSDGVIVAQAGIPLGPVEHERTRLLGALLAAGALALVAAAALGALSGRQTASGLVGALRRQRQFVADASHELRTPLTVVSTRAQLLARHLASAPIDEATRDVLAADVQRLLADSAGLADVVEDLLVASEPASGLADCADLVAVARDAVAGLSALGAERGVVLESATRDVGGAGEGEAVAVAIGAAPLRRSLVALIDNAVRHTPRGGTVTVAYGVRRGRGVVTVADTGPGIPDGVRARLFDRFAPGDPAPDDEAELGAGRRRYGLGLALVSDTVHRFAGELDVQTGPDGTTITLSLPRCPHRGVL